MSTTQTAMQISECLSFLHERGYQPSESSLHRIYDALPYSTQMRTNAWRVIADHWLQGQGIGGAR